MFLTWGTGNDLTNVVLQPSQPAQGDHKRGVAIGGLNSRAIVCVAWRGDETFTDDALCCINSIAYVDVVKVCEKNVD